MDDETSRKIKAYRTAAIFFTISGVTFIILSMATGKIGAFLPVGIALVVLSINFWLFSRKLTNS